MLSHICVTVDGVLDQILVINHLNTQLVITLDYSTIANFLHYRSIEHTDFSVCY
jgi:hypothetical protein